MRNENRMSEKKRRWRNGKIGSEGGRDTEEKTGQKSRKQREGKEEMRGKAGGELPVLSCCPLQGLSRPVIRHLELLHHNHTTTLEQVAAPHAPLHHHCWHYMHCWTSLIALQQSAVNRTETKLS